MPDRHDDAPRYKPQPSDARWRDRYVAALLEVAPPITPEQCWRVYSLLLQGLSKERRAPRRR